MTDLKCNVCGAELLPGTNFCRRCGSPGTAAEGVIQSEQPTALFGPDTKSVTTQRLDPRPTSPDPAMRLAQNDDSLAASQPDNAPTQPRVMSGLIILMFILGVITVVAVVRMRNRAPSVQTVSQTSEAGNLRYPGAKTLVDMTNADGSSTIQLETSDPLDRVESWYQTNLKLTKTVRLTSTSVVMKNEKATITLANEDDKTVVLIKRAP